MQPAGRSSPNRAADEKQDPAAITTEKFFHAIHTGDTHEFNVALDAAVSFQSPMGTYVGRPTVRAWVEFEVSMLRPFQHMIQRKALVSEDGLRVGRLEWCIGGLYITDVVTQTQMLTIRSIKRTVRRNCRTMQDHEIAEALLLAWTGPHFSKFLAPPAKGMIDSKAVVLPVLDFGFRGLTNVRSLISEDPNEGTHAIDNNIVFHFEEAAASAQSISDEKTKPAADDASKTAAASEADARSFSAKRKPNTVTIQAKNRAGEVNAIIIDKASLETKASDGTKLDALEDAEVNGTKRDRLRYVASGLRVSNNELIRANELESVTRIFLVNAFYFLTMVDLSSNKLVEIPNLSQLLSLQSLYLHGNNIDQWAELQKLQPLPQLTSLTLFGNPLQQHAQSSKMYKYSVLHYFYSPDGFKCFPSRQQTLLQHAQAERQDTHSRPLSRLQRALVAGGRCSPSPLLGSSTPDTQASLVCNAPQLPVRVSTASLAARRLNELSSSAALMLSNGGGEIARTMSRGRPASGSTNSVLALTSIRLRQLDHVTLSPKEAEALEQFLPAIKRYVKRAASPLPSSTDAKGGRAAAQKVA